MKASLSRENKCPSGKPFLSHNQKLHPDLDRVDAKHRHLFQAEKVNHFEHVYYKNSFKILAKFD